MYGYYDPIFKYNADFHVIKGFVKKLYNIWLVFFYVQIQKEGSKSYRFNVSRILCGW